MAARRYWMVNEIFDQFITNQFERRRTLWRAIRAQEAKGALTEGVRKRVLRAKQYLLTMPIAEHDLTQMEPSPMPGPGSRYAPMTAEQKSFQVRWKAQADMLLNLAESELRTLSK
jgi:phosphoglycerate transport regulatory protein PgtC